MTIAFTHHGWNDYVYWQEVDAETLQKINALIKDVKRDPFKGFGKPEPLKGNLAGYWSRRITDEHRLVYRVHGTKPDQALTIIQARFHYQ
jgi:toxin YoeB